MKVLYFVSDKGGSGQSFVLTNIAKKLASSGNMVLALELAYGNRYLDLAFDATDRVLYNLYDYAKGNASLDECASSVEDNLDLVCASLEYKSFDISSCMLRLINDSNEHYDYLIVDVSKGVLNSNLNFDGVECSFIFISDSRCISFRNAEALITSFGCRDSFSLILNRVNPRRIEKGYELAVDEIIDTLRIPILGVVYEFEGGFDKVLNCIRTDDKNLSETVFDNISKRLSGASVPLTQYKKANIFSSLFG